MTLFIILLVVDDPPLGFWAILTCNGGVYTISALSAAEAWVTFNDTHSLIHILFYHQQHRSIWCFGWAVTFPLHPLWTSVPQGSSAFHTTITQFRHISCQQVVFWSPIFCYFSISQQWLDEISSSKRRPPFMFSSLSMIKFCDYLDNGWPEFLCSRDDPLVFGQIYLLKYFHEFILL